MFKIKRGYEYFRANKLHLWNGELIRTVSWVSDPNKAKSFPTFEAADITQNALGYVDTIIVRS